MCDYSGPVLFIPKENTQKENPRGLGTSGAQMLWACDLEVTVNKPRLWQATAKPLRHLCQTVRLEKLKVWGESLMYKPRLQRRICTLSHLILDNTERAFIYLFIGLRLFMYLLIGCAAWLFFVGFLVLLTRD